jgi:hypothetical protein
MTLALKVDDTAAEESAGVATEADPAWLESKTEFPAGRDEVRLEVFPL